MFTHWRRRWKTEARGAEAPSISSALDKADVHLARVALVMAEADQPGRGGTLGAEVMARAAAIVQFTLDGWRALPDQGDGLGLSYRDRALSAGVRRLAAWLEERPERSATRREIQRAHVGGVRKPAELDALLADYEQTYTGSVTEVEQPLGGLPVVIVKAPLRRARERGEITVSPVATPMRPAENPDGKAKSGDATRGDTARGDTASGDTAPQEPS